MSQGFEYDQVYPDTPSVERRKLGESLLNVVAREYERLAEIATKTGVPVSLATLSMSVMEFGQGVANEALRLAQEQKIFDLDEALGAVYPPTRHRENADWLRYM